MIYPEKIYTSSDRRMILIEAILDKICTKLDIAYWNKYQKNYTSPFSNTGASYKNSTFSVQAYNWGEEDQEEEDKTPNFQYKNFKVWWYKYCGRGMYVKSKHPLTIKFLTKMLNDCVDSIDKDFRVRRSANV